MKHKTLFLLTFLFVFYPLAYADEINEVLISPKIRLIQKEIVEGDSKRIENQKVHFLDASGNTMKELKLEGSDRVKLSQNKKIIAIQKPNYHKQNIEMFDENGNFMRKQEALAYNDLLITDSGALIIFGSEISPSIPHRSGIVFYDNTGSLIKEEEISTIGLIGKMSKDNFFVVVYPDPHSLFHNITAIFAYYDLEGNRKWEYRFNDVSPFGEETLNIDEVSKEIILKICYKEENETKITKRTIIFNKDGKLMSKVEGW
jgi:hypothetical protein